MDILETD